MRSMIRPLLSAELILGYNSTSIMMTIKEAHQTVRKIGVILNQVSGYGLAWLQSPVTKYAFL